VSYENPEIPEGINDSDRRPLLNFLRLTAAAAALVAAPGAALFFLADRLAPLVPFPYEAAVTGELFGPPGTEGAIEPYLRELAARLVRAQDLPAEMTVTVHYDDGPVVNAFATLGGHVVLYQGLLETAADENALAMVIAHEIAHVRHRHPIASAGRSVALGFLLMLAGADSGGELVRAAASHGGAVTMLSFSRAQEAEADATALETLQRAYGHVGGAEDFFRHMLREAARREPPRFLSSHPLTDERIAALGAAAERRGWARDGARTPFPAAVRDDIERRRTSKLKPDARAPLQLPR
jgi:predicted Zn-dependent protease